MLGWILWLAPSLIARLIPTTIGLLNIKVLKSNEKALIYLFIYDIIGILIGAILVYLYRNNILMTHLYAIAEVTFLSIFFKAYLQNEGAKRVLNWFPVVFALVFIPVTFFVIGYENDNPAESATQYLFSITMGSLAMGSLMGKDENLIHQGHFWIVLGIVTFNLLNIGYMTMSAWLISSNSSLTMGLHSVLQYSFYASNLLFALGFWLIAKERKIVANND